jgi:hypothetical protein
LQVFHGYGLIELEPRFLTTVFHTR